MAKFLVTLVASVAWLIPHAWAQSTVDPFLRSAPSGPPESGISIGVRAGYGIPMGSLSGAPGDDLSHIIGGMIPLQVDLGWRFDRNWYAGGFFQYGATLLSSDFKSGSGCGTNGADCSSSSMRFGVDVIYTVLPSATVMPWVGIGAGYELTKWTYTINSQNLDRTVKGWEFAHLSVGADYRVAPWLRFGPFATFSLGQYQTVDTNYNLNTTPPTITANQSLDIPQKALHEWLLFGVKGTFDL